uniref:Pilus assembly protein PilE n=1 Tax=uncultured Thiotrichaceae bacterium TaxID=298394 RepID=A0A6S6UEU4_9GAMM|nr:MAG: Pilus assembly protein PilE [uncultured Thiotrichaceae bacterium]
MIFAKQKQHGFTLIEVMIVVAIIAIISAIAYPSYVKQVQKSKRSDAKVGLQQLAQRQEVRFTRTYSYASTLEQLGFGAGLDSPEGEYSQTVAATPDNCDGTAAVPCTGFTVTAVPNLGSSQVGDTDCATFTLDNRGRKGAENNEDIPADTTEICW